MTVESTTTKITATGTGSTATYPYTFKIFDDDQLEVRVKLLSTAVETTLTKTTDYTVTGVGVAAGGNVVLVNASQAWLDGSGFLRSTYSITIRRAMEFTQNTSITSQSSNLPELHEKQFDRHVMAELELREEVQRALQLPVTETGSSTNTTIADATTRANKLLAFDSSGNPTTTAFVTAANAAPVSSAFVTISTDSTLTNERVLTGTSNQITVTDNGAGSTVVLSTPQNIHTGATPTFASATLSTGGLTITAGGETITAGNLVVTAGDVTVTAGSVKMGATPATTGAVRLTNNTGLYVRNAGNTQDILIALVNASNQMSIGTSTHLVSIGFNVTGPLFSQGGAQWGYTPVSPTQLTANVNDYDPGSGTYYMMTSDASRNITGIVAGYSGQTMLISNVGSQSIVLTNEDAASTAANRILTGTGANLTVATNQNVMLIYGTSRWRVFKNA